MLKYECDVCHKVNVPADTYGMGVVPSGRAFTWMGLFQGEQVGLTIMPSLHGGNARSEGADAPHICGECVRAFVMEMIEEVWPEIDPWAGQPAEPFSNPDIMCKCGHPASMHELEIGRAPRLTICKSTDPEDTCVRFERADEDVSGSSGSDSDMREVRAEPEMPESNSDDSTKPQGGVSTDQYVCPSCSRRGNQRPGRDCTRPAAHIYGPS